jgi:hypothetical protein
MYNIETILEEWKIDCEIDQLRLEESSRNTPKLHAKYLEMLSKSKLEKKYLESQLDMMYKKKWLYYSGKMDVSEIKRLGWDPDPLDGLKVLKGDMEYYYRADPDMQNLNAKIDLAQTIIETLEEIINNLKWRHSTIKNMIDWQKFTNGI